MTRIILLSSLALSIAGCQPMDAMENKPSAFQQYQERLSALEMKVSTIAAPVAETTLVSDIAPVVISEPEPVEPEPECHGDVFRVSRCVDGRVLPW